CVVHSWYCTFTLTPGCCFWNALVAFATTVGHPDCASTCSQTVMLSADALVLAPEDPATATAAATATRQRATMLRTFIWKPPESGGPVALSTRVRLRWLVNTTFHFGWILPQRYSTCQYQLSRVFRAGRVSNTPETSKTRICWSRPVGDRRPEARVPTPPRE